MPGSRTSRIREADGSRLFIGARVGSRRLSVSPVAKNVEGLREPPGGRPVTLNLATLLSRTALAAAVTLAASCAALAEIPNGAIKIGVLSDFSGPFADQVGKGSFIAAQM